MESDKKHLRHLFYYQKDELAVQARKKNSTWRKCIDSMSFSNFDVEDARSAWQFEDKDT